MDPNANLREQRRLAQRLLHLDRPLVEIAGDASCLADLVEALDQWLNSGGFLPADWLRPEDRHPCLACAREACNPNGSPEQRHTCSSTPTEPSHLEQS